MKENEVEDALKKAVKRHGGRTEKLIIMYGAGMPDRTCFFPDGKILFVEVKQPLGVASAKQLQRVRNLRSLGFIAGFIWSKEDVDPVIDAFVAGEQLPESFFALTTRRPK